MQHRSENLCSQFFWEPESYERGTNRDLIFQEIGTVENIENFNDFEKTIDKFNDFEETIETFNGYEETIGFLMVSEDTITIECFLVV